jgi:hypothetical protein
MAEDVDTTARLLLACITDKLTAEERPVCRSYPTVGPPVIAFTTCCECQVEVPDPAYPGETMEVDASGEATIHLEQMYDADSNLEQINPIHACRRTTVAADMTIIVTRCYPRIDENGEMPDPDEVDEAALALHEDVKTIWRALTCPCNELRLRVRGVAVDAPPDAGCSVIAARVTVEVSP